MKQTLFAMLAITGTLLIAGPEEAMAQDAGDLTVEGRAGVSLPAGDLAHLQKTGPGGALTLSYWAHPRIGIQASASGDWLTGKSGEDGGIRTVEVPGMNLWHLTAGLDFMVVPPEESPWEVSVNAAAGPAILTSDQHQILSAAAPGRESNFSETYLGATGGLEAGYAVSEHVTFFATGQAHYAATDDEETDVLANFSSRFPEEGMTSAWTFPVQLGLELTY